MRAGPDRPPRRLIWDLPTRIVHWALVLLVPFSWWTAENDMMDRHRLSGYFILGLLVFRLLWGVVGGESARFAGFVRGPRAAWRFVRALATRAALPASVGHNPLGGWSVLAMLAALIGQVSLGLFAIDGDGLESGPLSHYVGYDTARLAAAAHEIVFYILIGLIALHLLAVGWHQFALRHNLIGPMITGRGDAPAGVAAPIQAPAWRAAAALVASAALAWFVANGLRLI